MLRRSAWALVAFVVAGNVAIALAFGVSRLLAEPSTLALPGIEQERVVDDRLWRGNAPDAEGMAALAAAGVTTVVDLRAESADRVPDAVLDELGLQRVDLPIRDGQAPPDAVMDGFLDVLQEADGLVYVHCGAGVGRTGAVVAAYQVTVNDRGAWESLRDNLAVGPPSLEQIVYVASLRGGAEGISDPPAALVAVSRLWDAPRRIWTRIRQW